MVAVDLSRWDESDPKGPVIDHSGPRHVPPSSHGESKSGGGGADRPGKPKLNRGVTVEIDSIPPANRPDRVLETLTLIQSYVPGARVMLVGTHLDKIGFVEGVRRMNALLDIVTEHVVQVNRRLEQRRAAVNESVRAYDQEAATPLANHLTGLQKANEQLQRSVAWPLVGAAAVSCVTGEAITLVSPSAHQGAWDTHKRMWHQYPASGEVGAKAVVEAVLTAIREHMSHVVFRRTINASFLRLARMAMFDLGSSIISDRRYAAPELVARASACLCPHAPPVGALSCPPPPSPTATTRVRSRLRLSWAASRLSRSRRCSAAWTGARGCRWRSWWTTLCCGRTAAAPRRSWPLISSRRWG